MKILVVAILYAVLGYLHAQGVSVEYVGGANQTATAGTAFASPFVVNLYAPPETPCTLVITRPVIGANPPRTETIYMDSQAAQSQYQFYIDASRAVGMYNVTFTGICGVPDGEPIEASLDVLVTQVPSDLVQLVIFEGDGQSAYMGDSLVPLTLYVNDPPIEAGIAGVSVEFCSSTSGNASSSCISATDSGCITLVSEEGGFITVPSNYSAMTPSTCTVTAYAPMYDITAQFNLVGIQSVPPTESPNTTIEPTTTTMEPTTTTMEPTTTTMEPTTTTAEPTTTMEPTTATPTPTVLITSTVAPTTTHAPTTTAAPTSTAPHQSLITCFGVLQNSNHTCSGHGMCTSQDHCACNTHYTGPMCEKCAPSQVHEKYWGDDRVCECISDGEDQHICVHKFHGRDIRIIAIVTLCVIVAVGLFMMVSACCIIKCSPFAMAAKERSREKRPLIKSSAKERIQYDTDELEDPGCAGYMLYLITGRRQEDWPEMYKRQ